MAEKVDKYKIQNAVNFGTGINLIPPTSHEQVKVEEKKTKVNLGAVLAIFLFVLLSLGIVGYNVVTKLNLNAEKDKLYNTKTGLEPKANGYIDLITKNNLINQRIRLFEQVQDQTISYKTVLAYWQDVSKSLGTINSVKLSSGLVFKVHGSAASYTEVAKLWHFLSIDTRVINVNLKGVSVTGDGVDFEFDGKLNFDSFK